LAPPSVFASTLAVSALPAGVVAVIVVAFTTTTLVAGGADRHRPRSVWLVPVIVTAVAPGVISEARLKSVTSHAQSPRRARRSADTTHPRQADV
jgi:hypothetical protein